MRGLIEEYGQLALAILAGVIIIGIIIGIFVSNDINLTQIITAVFNQMR